ncbi:MAG: hypothetical protein MUO61_03590 [Dehalococcoidia bacterium]|nr:hypothetical protein [Dehalococcoidia bacterium]
MDKSEINIKMCEKAGEIQSLAPNPKIIIFGGNDYYFHLDRDAPLVWLPRQDQLQEIYGDYPKCVEAIYMSEEACIPFNWCDFSSMEQLWLAYVMKDKYNKVWNGEDWVNDTTSRH